MCHYLAVPMIVVTVYRSACRLPACSAEGRSDVYLLPCGKQAKHIGVKARGKADTGGIRDGDKGLSRDNNISFCCCVAVVVVAATITAKTLPLPYLFPELYNTVDLDAFSDDIFLPVEVKECTKRDGSGGERLNKHVVFFCWIFMFMFQQPLLGLII
jgi:hypothetical protein